MIEHGPLFGIEFEGLRGNEFLDGIGIALLLAIDHGDEGIGGREFLEQAFYGRGIEFGEREGLCGGDERLH